MNLKVNMNRIEKKVIKILKRVEDGFFEFFKNFPFLEDFFSEKFFVKKKKKIFSKNKSTKIFYLHFSRLLNKQTKSH